MQKGIQVSPFTTCKVNGMEPWVWLKNVLTRIARHPINQLEKLLPHHPTNRFSAAALIKRLYPPPFEWAEQ